jgi:hypothetical protein
MILLASLSPKLSAKTRETPVSRVTLSSIMVSPTMVTFVTILFEENKGLPKYFHYLSADYM